MTWGAFQTRVSGKWVLAGEHAVLKGAAAIAIPHPEFGMELKFTPSYQNDLEIEPQWAQTVIPEILHAIQAEENSAGRPFHMPQGRLEIHSTIPLGAGLGSSAALCVALGHWLSPLLKLETPAQLQDFATRLEHRFHGRSSGMDVAVIVAGQPISFTMKGSEKAGPQVIGVTKLPKFTFHDTGLRARTSECVAKVEAFRQSNPALGAKLDEQMSAASKMALEGLIQYDSSPSQQALEVVAHAMRNAQECYESWQLVPAEARALQEKLLSEGALATKITGAGDGGMLVALWADN
jgi:mevalonate kinase